MCARVSGKLISNEIRKQFFLHILIYFIQSFCAKKKIFKALSNYILVVKPRVLAIQFKETQMLIDLQNMLNEIEGPEIQIEMVDDDLAIVISNSTGAKDEFPGCSRLRHETVSIARQVQVLNLFVIFPLR